MPLGRDRRQRRRRAAIVGGAAVAAKKHHDAKQAQQQEALAPQPAPVELSAAGGLTPEVMEKLKQLGDYMSRTCSQTRSLTREGEAAASLSDTSSPRSREKG